MDLYRLNTDSTVAIDNQVSFYPMESCPIRVKVQLHTLGGVAVYGMLGTTPDERNMYQGWRPIPSGRKTNEQN